MNDRMKLLIAYDGSESADAILGDLLVAGLPCEAEATVISVGELWLPPPTYTMGGVDLTEEFPSDIEGARLLASRACEHIQSDFPDWEVSPDGYIGSPALEIITKADKW